MHRVVPTQQLNGEERFYQVRDAVEPALNRSLSDSESPLNLGSGTARALSMVPAVANSFCRELSEGVGARDELGRGSCNCVGSGSRVQEGIYSPSESEEGDLECLDARVLR